MGHKAFKEHFNITAHIVSIDKGVLYIGSDHASKLVGFNMHTGEIMLNEVFGRFLDKYYPHVKEASNEERLALIQVGDHFDKSIVVYTYRDGEIVERLCEELGFPNVTHDGELMYNNTHFIKKIDALNYAHRKFTSSIENISESIADLEERLVEKQNLLELTKKQRAELEREVAICG